MAGQVDDLLEAQLALDDLKAGDPNARLFVFLFGLFPLVSLEKYLVFIRWLLAVAMMALVVEHEDVSHTHEIGRNPLDHLALSFLGVQIRASTFEQGSSAAGKLGTFAEHEGVKVGDDDLCLSEVGEHVGGYQLAAVVIAVGVVGLEHAQTVLDGYAGGDDKESASESLGVGPADGVDGLPGDDHCHDGGLAGAGCDLEGYAQQLRVGVPTGAGEAIEDAFAGRSQLGGNLGQPDDSLDGLDLAEERAVIAEPMMAPVQEQPGGLGSNAPVVGALNVSPLIDTAANLIHRGGDELVLLLLGGEPLAFVEDYLLLSLGRAALSGLGDGRDELSNAPAFNYLVGRLPVFAELPVAARVVVGRVKYWPFEKQFVHSSRPLLHVRCETCLLICGYCRNGFWMVRLCICWRYRISSALIHLFAG